MIKKLHSDMIRPASPVKFGRKKTGLFIGHQKGGKNPSFVKGLGGVPQVPTS
jgi:hypothetical protein